MADKAAPLTTEQINWIRLSRSENVGPITFNRLIGRYKTAAKALDALPDLIARGGAKRQIKICPAETIEKEYKELARNGGTFICSFEDIYPDRLKAIDDAPPVLSCLGNRDILNKNCFGIVGARNASINGRQFTQKIARDLGEADVIIASGLARGIDTAAHQGALKSGTIAVVAGGVDIVYPRENNSLYREIIEQGGLIVAENSLGTNPTARHFPRRNRIISGLSSGVLVVEASIRSGSLITARMAAEQGRDVFAVPGFPSDPRSGGPNKLLKDGAILTEKSSDILENTNFELTCFTKNDGLFEDEYLYEPEDTNLDADLSENERDLILQSLSHSATSVDEIIRSSGKSVQDIQNTLLELELAGRLQRLPGNRVSLTG